MNFSSIMSEATSLLKNRTLGGITKESAMEALQKFQKAAEEALGKAQQELEQFKGKSAREMAELTSKNDKVTLELKDAQAKLASKEAQLSATEEKLVKTKEQLSHAKSVHTSQRVLDNGNIQIRKVNNNGAVMTKETTADGKLLSYNVTTLDGSIRRTKFNPATGKPIRTYTNTTGDKVIDYNIDGKTVSEKLVNVKKAGKKPTLVDKKVIDGANPQVVETYSDGSRKTITYKGHEKDTEYIYDANGNKLSQRHYNYDRSTGKPAGYREEIYNSQQKLISEINVRPDGTKTIGNLESFDGGKSWRYVSLDCETTKGHKLTSKFVKDENGIYTSNYETTIKYPKSSKIKSSKITYKYDFDPEKEILSMRDGSKVVVKVDNNYGVYELEAIPKGQKSGTIMQRYGDNKESFNELFNEIVNEGFITSGGEGFIPLLGGKYCKP